MVKDVKGMSLLQCERKLDINRFCIKRIGKLFSKSLGKGYICRDPINVRHIVAMNH